MQFFGILLLLAFVSSCGKSNSSAGMPVAKSKVLPVNGSNIRGLYMAKFFTINSHVNGSLPGSATIQRQEDKFFAYVRLFGGAPNAWHQQNIYEGSRCPNMGDDLNKDGYIDIEEGNKVWGKVLIPLDANISSQYAGKNIFPLGDATGSYFYERVGSFDKMFKDLKSEDKNMADNVSKLLPEQGLDIEGRVVVIQGTANTVIYPETVASYKNQAPYQSLPIACGVFSRVTKIPGTPHPEEIPGEVDDIEEGDAPEGDNWEPETPTPENPDTDWDRPDRDDDYHRPRTDGENDDPWYDRVIDWWRSRWDRARGSRRHDWGNGGSRDDDNGWF